MTGPQPAARSAIGAIVALTLILMGGSLAVRAFAGRGPQTVRAALSLEETLGGADTAGFARALEPREFDFPLDHGAHPAFRNEWWYLTGNLTAQDGRRFGYQLTLFRTALSASMPDRGSDWATRQAWMAHFALTDVRGRRFYAFERFARGALGLAGAQADPLRVWLEDWSIESQRPAAGSAEADRPFPLRVRAQEDGVAVDLVLDAGKPIVLNGQAGLSRKGSEPGNASYYYSFTRLPTRGTVLFNEHRLPVSGETWIDREWSTSALAPGVVGWDWFAIQLDDSTELMVYRLRHADGSTDPFSAGTHVGANGETTPLDANDFVIETADEWSSPIDDTRWPSRWTLRLPALGLLLDITPVMPDQEHLGSFRYWEGAVDAAGSRNGRPVNGHGYVELTGYAESSDTARAELPR
jgi:predicted secreted hydrolase